MDGKISLHSPEFQFKVHPPCLTSVIVPSSALYTFPFHPSTGCFCQGMETRSLSQYLVNPSKFLFETNRFFKLIYHTKIPAVYCSSVDGLYNPATILTVTGREKDVKAWDAMALSQSPRSVALAIPMTSRHSSSNHYNQVDLDQLLS